MAAAICPNCKSPWREAEDGVCAYCGHKPFQADLTRLRERASAVAAKRPERQVSENDRPATPQSPAASPRVGGWGPVVVLFGLIGGIIGWLHLKAADRERADHVLRWGLVWTVVSGAAYAILVIVITLSLAHSVDKAIEAAAPVTTASFTETTTEITETETEPATPAVPLGQPVVAQPISAETQDGYTAAGEVDVYRVRHVDSLPALPNSNRSSIAACSVDSQRDAIIPISVSLTNTTGSFSTVMSLSLVPEINNESDYAAAQVTLEGDLQFSDISTACDGSDTRYDGAVYSVIWSTPSDPGSSVDGDFFLIVHDYYSPNLPDGNVTFLDDAVLHPSVSFGPEGSKAPAVTRCGGDPEGSFCSIWLR